MKILHIANSYGGTEVYTELVAALDREGIVQRVFVPLGAKNRSRVGNGRIDFRTAGSSIRWSCALAAWHRYFYGAKIAATVRAAQEWLDGDSWRPDVLHAHTAFSDGAAARMLSRRLGVPYVVAVRNADIDGYWARLPWRRRFFLGILREAARIVFLSSETRRLFLSGIVPAGVSAGLEAKSVVLSNGIRDFWLANRHAHAPELGRPATVVYAGGFFARKGVRETVLAVEALRAEGRDVRFVAVGRGLPYRPRDPACAAELEHMAADRPWLVLKDHTDAAGLAAEFRAADVFAMPSARETFGLVYAEALSQGLPVLWARGEGFDGYRSDGELGHAARALDPEDIARALRAILDGYPGLALRVAALDLGRDFAWPRIAAKYTALYEEVAAGKGVER